MLAAGARVVGLGVALKLRCAMGHEYLVGGRAPLEAEARAEGRPARSSWQWHSPGWRPIDEARPRGKGAKTPTPSLGTHARR